MKSSSRDSPDGGGKRRSPDPNAPIYGELIVLGCVQNYVVYVFALAKNHEVAA